MTWHHNQELLFCKIKILIYDWTNSGPHLLKFRVIYCYIKQTVSFLLYYFFLSLFIINLPLIKSYAVVGGSFIHPICPQGANKHCHFEGKVLKVKECVESNLSLPPDNNIFHQDIVKAVYAQWRMLENGETLAMGKIMGLKKWQGLTLKAFANINPTTPTLANQTHPHFMDRATDPQRYLCHLTPRCTVHQWLNRIAQLWLPCLCSAQ